MQTSLQGIAKKAAHNKTYRFRNLFGLLTAPFVMWCWQFLNKRSAPGVDRTSAREYEQQLGANILNLVDRVKRGTYRARLILRRYIPKGAGKWRPLGLPVLEDKLLQTAVTNILNAIYEQDFLPCSFGYRAGIGARDAVKQLSAWLYYRPVHYIVEADIKGYFDHIDHDMLLAMLRERIDDRPFLRLIQKWLKAGILDTDGQVLHPATGTPQGGIISPILANIYLHYVLDVWFETVVKVHCRGQAYLIRYADDFVCAFQFQDDAERFYRVLGKRLGTYGLTLAEDKTQLLRFSRHHREDKARFVFLGFEFRWTESWKTGKVILLKRTAPKKLRQSLRNFTEWCKTHRHWRLNHLMETVTAKLRGYFNYYGIRGNAKSLAYFYDRTMNILFKWLNRRSQKRSYTWEGFKQLLQQYRVPRPRIVQQ
jgi:group II intron reverse transcriptase/maturase